MGDLFYYYKAKLVRVVDGDTIRCDIDLGFGIWQHNKVVRLYGINAPESRTRDLEEKKKGLESKAWLTQQLVDIDGEFILRTHQDDSGKYGRILGDIMVEDGMGLVNLNEVMLLKGLANLYE